MFSGSAQVTFIPEISANYGLSIMLQGVHIQGSPFKIRVRNDETIATHCRLYGPNLTTGVAGERSTFFIQGMPAPAWIQGNLPIFATVCRALVRGAPAPADKTTRIP